MLKFIFEIYWGKISILTESGGLENFMISIVSLGSANMQDQTY